MTFCSRPVLKDRRRELWSMYFLATLILGLSIFSLSVHVLCTAVVIPGDWLMYFWMWVSLVTSLVIFVVIVIHGLFLYKKTILLYYINLIVHGILLFMGFVFAFGALGHLNDKCFVPKIRSKTDKCTNKYSFLSDLWRFDRERWETRVQPPASPYISKICLPYRSFAMSAVLHIFLGFSCIFGISGIVTTKPSEDCEIDDESANNRNFLSERSVLIQ